MEIAPQDEARSPDLPARDLHPVELIAPAHRGRIQEEGKPVFRDAPELFGLWVMLCSRSSARLSLVLQEV